MTPTEALLACVTTARHRDYAGIGYYIDMGYIPDEKNGVTRYRPH